MCVIDGTDPGGFTIWNGTTFNCGQSNNILLRHNLFGTQTGAFGSCNEGTISGQSLGVSPGNVYTSQLQVNITNSSRSELVGRTVQCVYSPDGSTYISINSSTIMISGMIIAMYTTLLVMSQVGQKIRCMLTPTFIAEREERDRERD